MYLMLKIFFQIRLKYIFYRINFLSYGLNQTSLPNKNCLIQSFLTACFLTLLCLFALQSLAQAQDNISPKQEDFGGHIVFGTIGEASNLIPYLATDSASHEVADLLYVSLLRYNKDLKIEPFAAKEYSVSKDGKLIRFTLREGIFWQDGTELTADDVEFTWKIVTDPKTASPYAEDFLQVKEFRKTGRYSFEVSYEKYFARALGSWMSAILPKHILEGQDLRNTKFARNPIGAGPYRLQSWEAGLRVTLTASPTYFLGEPHVSKVTYKIIPDISTMFLETRAGKLDVMNLTPQQYLRQTSGEPWDTEFRKYRYLSSSYVFLGFNMLHPLFEDVRMRKAISYAIDREGIIKGVLMGQGVPAFGPYKPGSWAYHDKLKAIQQNINKSKQLLLELGFADNDGDGILEKDGQDLSFTILTNQGNEQRILTAIVIQSQLKAVGINVQIRTVEWAAFIKEFVDTGRFDTVILGWTIGQDPDIFEVWHSSKARSGGLNFTRYINPEIDALLEAGRATPDMEKRKKLYYQMQEIMAQEQPYCFLFVPYALPVIQSRFQGIAPALAGIMYNFDDWWVPKKLQRNALEQ